MKEYTANIDKTIILSLLVILCTISSISADSYLPALPLIQDYFSTTSEMLQYSVTVYFIGFSTAQLIYGPASDYYGRKPLIITGIFIALTGSIICAFSPNISTFLTGRLIQGIGVAASIPIARTILTDLYSKKEVSRTASILNTIFAIMPALSPLLGTYLVLMFDWQSPFVMTALQAVIILLLVFKFLPETNIDTYNPDASIKKLFHNYRKLLTSRTFISYSLCTCLAYSGVVAYTTASPFLFQVILNLTMEQFSWLTITISLSYVLGGWLNIKLIERTTLDNVIIWGLMIMLVSASLMMSIGLLGSMNIAVILLPMIMFMIGTRLIFSNAMAGAFSAFQGITGVASSLYGFFQIAGSILSSALIAYLPKNNQLPLASILLIVSLFATIQFILFIRFANITPKNELT